jgi:hypothetical protein
VRQWWDDILDAVDSLRFKLQEIEGIDDERALTAQRIIGTFRLTGIEVDFLWGSVVSVREGKILGAVGYSSREEARQAVGRA